MADFCNQCAEEDGLPTGDLKGITPEDAWQEGRACVVLCEGCGPIQVDPEGNCASKNCFRPGHAVPWVEGDSDV